MDICLTNNEGKVTSVIDTQNVISIEQRPEDLRNEVFYKLVLKGDTKLFNDVYDADAFFDNEVPEAPVKIDVVSHDINTGIITVLGYQTAKTLLNITN